MRRIVLTSTLVIAAAGLVAWLPGSDPAAEVQIREWEVPWEASRPRDPYVGPEGRVWFVGQRSHYVASLDPETGEFERYDLADGTGPHNLIVSDDGTVYYAGNRAAHIGVLDPATGEIRKIPTEVRDPHTQVFNREGDIWFTAQGANQVAKLDVETEEIRYYPVPIDGARPYGIIVDRHDADRPWIALLGTNKLATVDPGSDVLREVDVPREGARPRRLGMTSDGTIWFVDYAEGRLWSFEPGSGEFRDRVLPGGEDSRPYGMAVDADDRVWMVETGVSPNRFVGFDPASGEFIAREAIPSGGGTVRHMHYHAPADEVWFGADTNTIGRARLP